MHSYTPLFGIEIVGTGADVLGESEGELTMGDGDETARGIGWKCEGFTTKISKGGVVIDINSGE